jgi:Spy/CpxP family protein refolding chaperone
MIEFFFGTACLLAMVGVVRGGRRGHCHGGAPSWRHGQYRSGPSGRGARGGFARAAGEVLKRRLDIDPDQEDIVDHALSDLRDTARALKEVVNDSREELAAAFGGDDVDVAAIDAVWARHDEALARARREAVSAVKQIHAVLDPEQRERAVQILTNARPGWR